MEPIAVMNFRTTLLFVRHLPTVANRYRLVQGYSDSVIVRNATNNREFVATVDALTNMTIDAAYCSDQGRAMATFDYLREAIPSLPLAIHEPGLREIDFGAYTGLPLRVLMPTIRYHKQVGNLSYPGGGESGNRFVHRVEVVVQRIVSAHPGESILVVTHYGVIETFLRRLWSLPPEEQIEISPGSLVTVTV
jgi:broad specificity phosphatase PhoE